MTENEIKNIIKREIKKNFEYECRGDIWTLKGMLKRGKRFAYEMLWKFREELDIEHGGFVYYPPTETKPGNSGYNFDFETMKKWIQDNQTRIFEK